MRPFRYIFDPLFIVCVALYALNRFVLKAHFQLPFLHNHLNDLLCIPVWVPIGLLIKRAIRLRADDGPPAWSEIFIPVLLWGWIFEVYLPTNGLGRSWCTPDPGDITAYALGAIGAALFWNRQPSCAAEQPG